MDLLGLTSASTSSAHNCDLEPHSANRMKEFHRISYIDTCQVEEW